MAETGKKPRPPIVAVLGHVDHGKTTLLDKIRKTNVTAKEAGGITQSIGAWQVETKEGEKITFIDTPGHEAFQAMRSRGAQVADLAVLVVAADDGVMPQTRESLEYIRKAETPFLVAITKVDLKTADPEGVRNQLVEEGVLLEGKGGDIVAVEVSGVTGQGIDELLEMINLLAELHEVQADSQALLEAPVVETELDRRRGPGVRVVVREGTLKVADKVRAGEVSARVRGLFDEWQKPIKEVSPGMPAEILGFSSLPPIGSVLQPAQGAKEAVPERKRRVGKIEGFLIVLKADTAGSLEAVAQNLKGKVTFLEQGVGDITESDIQLASPVSAPIIGFNVRAGKEIEKIAEEEGVPIHTYQVIYELLEDVENWVREVEERRKEKVLGKATILAEFPYDKKRIAGGRVSEGKIAKTDRIRVLRDGEVIGEARPTSLKIQDKDVSQVEQGQEFGILFSPQLDFKVGDVIESFLPKKQ